MIKKKKKKEKRRIRPQLNSVSSMSIPSHQAHQAFAAPTSTLTDMVKDVKIVEEELKEEVSADSFTLRYTLSLRSGLGRVNLRSRLRVKINWG